MLCILELENYLILYIYQIQEICFVCLGCQYGHRR
jgi:hypothetical protein